MDEKLKRMPNENEDQYFYRICKMKDALGFTWYQMADIFNEEFGCDKENTVYRKRWNSFERVFNANVDHFFILFVISKAKTWSRMNMTISTSCMGK